MIRHATGYSHISSVLQSDNMITKVVLINVLVNLVLGDRRCPLKTKLIHLPWTYEDTHAGDWISEEVCTQGSRQSPINIPRIVGNAQIDGPNLKFDNYGISPPKMRLRNNGVTFIIDLDSLDDVAILPKVSGGGLNGTYIFYESRFHWSISERKGSEHRKSHTLFPLEAQLFHYKSDYGTPEAAQEEPDGLLALAVLFQMSSEMNPRLEYFIPFLGNISRPGCELLVSEPMPLANILPRFRQDFYRYSGSLPYPPCTENVEWIVFLQTVPVSLKQKETFEKLMKLDLDGSLSVISDNARPTQPLNRRIIYQRRFESSSAICERLISRFNVKLMLSVIMLRGFVI